MFQWRRSPVSKGNGGGIVTDGTIVVTSEYLKECANRVVIDKPVTLTGGASKFDMKGAGIVVKSSGVVIENLENIGELIVEEFAAIDSNPSSRAEKGEKEKKLELKNSTAEKASSTNNGLSSWIEQRFKGK